MASLRKSACKRRTHSLKYSSAPVPRSRVVFQRINIRVSAATVRFVEEPVQINRERNLTWDDVLRAQVSSRTLLTPRLPGQQLELPQQRTDKAETHQLMPGGRLMPLGCIPRHRVAVIVPFRARDQHLTYFVNHLYPFLRSQLIDFIIIVVEQVHNSQLTTHTIPATSVLNAVPLCHSIQYILIIVIVTSGQSTSNLTKNVRIAAVHGRFTRIRQVAPVCTPV